MKTQILYLFILLGWSCTKKVPCEDTLSNMADPALILEDLKLNYIQYYDEMKDDSIDRKFYFEFYSITSPAKYDSLAIRYKQAVNAFYHADKKMIDYLLSFEKSESYNLWLFMGKGPYSSNIVDGVDMIMEPRAALILIDYYLRGKCKPINVKPKPKKLTYPTFRRFYELNKGKSLKQLRWLYGWEF